MRTWTPSTVPCALWPLTATSTAPRPTAGASALLSGRCCTSSRCVVRGRGPAGCVWHSPRPVSWAPLPCRVASVRKRLSASASRCSTWTAGPGAESTLRSRLCWGRACTTTSRWRGWQGGGPQLVCCRLARAHCPLCPQNNELLRDIFGLGPVLVLDATALKACKISRFEKVCTLGHFYLLSIPSAWSCAGAEREALGPRPS